MESPLDCKKIKPVDEQTPGVTEGQGGLVCCSPWGCKESDTTKQLSNNNMFEVR